MLKMIIWMALNVVCWKDFSVFWNFSPSAVYCAFSEFSLCSTLFYFCRNYLARHHYGVQTLSNLCVLLAHFPILIFYLTIKSLITCINLFSNWPETVRTNKNRHAFISLNWWSRLIFTGFKCLRTRSRLSKDEIWNLQDSTVGMSKK